VETPTHICYVSPQSSSLRAATLEAILLPIVAIAVNEKGEGGCWEVSAGEAQP